MRTLTRLLLALAVLGGLAAAALALYVRSFDIDMLRDPIAQQIARALGRDVSIGRVVEWGELLRPRLVLEEVVVSSLAEEGGVELARVERATVGLDLPLLLRGSVQVESLLTEGVSLTIDVDPEGHWIWAAAGRGPPGAGEGLEVGIEDVDVERASITYRDARTGETARLVLDHLSISLDREGIGVECVGRLGGEEFDLEGQFTPHGPAGTLQGPFDGRVEGRVAGVELELRGHVATLLELGALDLELRARGVELPLPDELASGLELAPGTLTGRLEGAEGVLSLHELVFESAGSGAASELRVTGGVGDLTGAVEVDLGVSFTGPIPQALRTFLPRLPEDLEPIRSSARVHGYGTRLDVADVVVELGKPGSTSARVEGELRDLLGLRAFEGVLHVATAELGRLVPELAGRLDGSLRGNAKVRAAGASVQLEDVDLTLAGAEGLTLRLRGTANGSAEAFALDLDARLAAQDVRVLGALLGRELPDLGPVSGTARLRGSGWDIDAEAIELEVGRAERAQFVATGAARDLGGDADARLQVRVTAATTRPLAELLGRELPELGRIEARAALAASKHAVRVGDVTLRTAHPDGLELLAEGELHGAAPLEEMDLAFEVESPSLSALDELVGTPLPTLGPLRAAGRLYVEGEERWSVRGLEARLGDSEIAGSLSLVRAGPEDGRRRLVAELSASELQLADFLPVRTEHGAEEPVDGVDRWHEELPLASLPDVDVDLVLRVGSLEGRFGLTVEEVALRAVLAERVLRLTALDLQLEGSPVQLTGGIDAGSDPPRVWLEGEGDYIDLAAVAAQFTDQPLVAGHARLKADLTSQGRTATELVAGLGGEFALVLLDGQIATDAVLLLQRHLLQALTFRGSIPEFATAECLVADFDLDGGVATTRTLLVDGAHVLLHGRGSIDLRSGGLDLLLTPSAKSPRLFAVHLPVHLSGRYDDPVARPQRRSLASTAAVAFVGNLLVPGVGLLAPFVSVGSLGATPCAEAVEAFLAPPAPAGGAASEGEGP